MVGDVMLDVTARISSPLAYASDTPAVVTMQPGGSAANTAGWLAASGHRSAFVGRIGADDAGSRAREALVAQGVEAHLPVSAGRATGMCVVIVDALGERTMLPDPGANADLRADDLDGARVVAGDHVHLSGYVLLNPACAAAGLAILQRARQAGATTSLDPSSAAPLRARQEDMRAGLALVDLVIANEEEAEVLTGRRDPEAALAALAGLVPVAVVKCGAAGAMARAGIQHVSARARPAAVVDTTGAGDSFAAGFLPAWAGGLGLARALAAGLDLASVAVSRVGAGPPPR
ncbi:MAG: sugar kinase [Actinomycetota bacterium]|nr:sugar kinase [Actinomycetota bacterium]